MRKYRALALLIMAVGVFMICRNALVSYSMKEVFSSQEKKIICIDPGHQLKGNSETEPIEPNSVSYKIKVSSGTVGIATKKPEYELNLEASLKLKAILEERGYQVVMTRETHDVDISNRERAIFANQKNCDMVVRIHADSSDNSSITGGCILIPAKDSKCCAPIYDKSSKCASLVDEQLKKSGFKINGIFERNDLTGFNWSTVPVVLVEMGFMSNYAEDVNMADGNYQQRMMEAIANGLDEYFKK